MGCSFRTSTHLTLDFPRIFWKRVVGLEVFLEDFEFVDKGLFDLLKSLKGCTIEEFNKNGYQELTFSYSNSSGNEVELRKGGKSEKVTFQNRLEFVDLVLQMRSTESDSQIQAIQEGFQNLVP